MMPFSPSWRGGPSSFFFSANNAPPKLRPLPGPSKWEMVLLNVQVPDDAVWDFRESELTDFSQEYVRVRSFMERSYQFKGLLSDMETGVPIWVYWGHANDPNA
jgi:hypothetical protein